jgi:hypothetical protein
VIGIVVELPLALDAVEPDPFVADLAGRPASPPGDRRRPRMPRPTSAR